MANTWYAKGAEKVLSAAINFPSDTIKAVFVKSAYTLSQSHEFLTDLGANTVGTAWTLGSKTITGGVFDAADTAPTAFTAGDSIKAVAIYKDSGSSATSPLLFYFDVVTGLPLTTNGGELSIPWPDGAAKIMSLL